MDLGSNFEPIMINRPKVMGDYDVKYEIHYCGVCHSDVKLADNLLNKTIYPIVPGHETSGEVVEIGPKVTKFKVGDRVSSGVIADSCLGCKNCLAGDEQYCIPNKMVTAYNDFKRYSHIGGNPDTQIHGGTHAQTLFMSILSLESQMAFLLKKQNLSCVLEPLFMTL